MLGTEYSWSVYLSVFTCPTDITVLPSMCFIICFCVLLCVRIIRNSEDYKEEKFAVIRAARDFR